ncbi:hypothetical protein KM043_012708 [Ampulex compressa]|nr:hypothetical protein KM043_012708 [Ampulex compressa]
MERSDPKNPSKVLMAGLFPVVTASRMTGWNEELRAKRSISAAIARKSGGSTPRSASPVDVRTATTTVAIEERSADGYRATLRESARSVERPGETELVSRAEPRGERTVGQRRPPRQSSRTIKTEARYQTPLERARSAQGRTRFLWSLHSLAAAASRGILLHPSKSWLAEAIGADEARSSITTYFHSYPFVPGGAVPLPPPLLNSINNAAAAAITPGLVGHLFGGQQACNLGCTCTCPSILANCNPHHHQHHHQQQQQQQQHQHHHHHHQQQHHRALGAATVLLQPVDHIKDTMVSRYAST